MRRTDWILGFALIVVLIMVAVLGIFLWQQSRLVLDVTPNSSSVISTATAGGKTSIVAFGMAQNYSNQWQDDATLISAKATWHPNLPMKTLLNGSEDWSFTFYSPSAREAVSIWVTVDSATVSEPYEVRTAISPAWVSSWKINSDEAIQIFMNNGGEEIFATEADVLLTMQLSTVTENGKVEWFVTALSDRTGRGLSVVIDATTGDVLEVFRDN